MRLENKPAEKPSPAKATAIALKIKDAQATLATLQKRHKLAALDSIDGNIGNALATVKAEIQSTLAEIETLTAAHAAAAERDQREEAMQLAAQAKSQISAIKKFLARQHEAAQGLSRAIEAVGVAYRALLENGEKANAVVLLPGMSWPRGTDYSRKTLDKLVALELYRLTARSNMNGNDCLPKPNCEVRYNMQPQVIPPLIDELKRWHDDILVALNGDTLR